MVGPEKGRDRSTVSTGGELLIRRIRTEYVLDVSKRRQLRSEKSTGSEKKMATNLSNPKQNPNQTRS